MTDLISARLRQCYTGVVFDTMRAMGLKNFILPPEIRPIFPELRLAGPVFTINGKANPTAEAHETLLAWTELLSKAKPGHVWLSQPNDRVSAHMGELSAETLLLNGVLGCFVDGYIRDVNFLLRMGFQSWSRGFTPKDIVGSWLPDGYDVTIRIGDVTIDPGDYICADRDGALIVPQNIIEAVIEESEKSINTENKIRGEIMNGIDPKEAYLKFNKF